MIQKVQQKGGDCRQSNGAYQKRENHKRDSILPVLGKIEIWSDQSVISEIDQIFAEASRHIPLENRRLYIEFLLGHIMAKVADPPHKWHVSFDDFEQMVIDATGRFAKSDHVYLPSDTGGEPSPEDCAALQEKVFVKEIERIEYDQVIHSAIDDYWRTHTQVLRSAQSNILFMASLPAYKDDLKRRLDGEKRQASRRMRGQDHCAHITRCCIRLCPKQRSIRRSSVLLRIFLNSTIRLYFRMTASSHDITH